MNEFEEQFPEIDVRRHPEAAMIYECKYLRLYLQKHCLSKQKVKDALDRFWSRVTKDKQNPFYIGEINVCVDMLKEELKI